MTTFVINGDDVGFCQGPTTPSSNSAGRAQFDAALAAGVDVSHLDAHEWVAWLDRQALRGRLDAGSRCVNGG
jgi:hypothetical protein